MSKQSCARPGSRNWLLVVVTCAATTTSACASNGSLERDPPQEAGAADNAGDVPLNLLSGGRTRADGHGRTLQIGDGSYLCTPAGFGQRSWCRRN